MALMLRITKPLCGTGDTVIVDSIFCVLKALIGMYDIGVFVCSVERKRRYCPESIYGDQINANFGNK